MTMLSGWENFYVIVGSSAGALIGLQFVVLTLIADRPIPEDTARAGQAFATPNIVHFGAVLLLSGIQSAPWEQVLPASILWGVLGVCGMLYAAVVSNRMRTQNAYMPVAEDWLFHSVLPLIAYTVLAAAAFTAHSYLRQSLFAIGAASLLLLFVGIHNAWDAVTFHVFTKKLN